MKLTLVISSLGAGGAERIISDLANYWASHGHEVTLVTLSSSAAHPFYPLNSQISLVQLGQSQEEVSRVMRPWYILTRLLAIRTAMRKLKPDMVVSFVDIMNMTTLIATLGLKIPVAISERTDPNFHKLSWFYTWLRFKIYPYCYKLIVQTKSSARYFPRNFQNFICVIPNPVSAPPIQKMEPSSKVQRLITIGRLEPEKNHATLINAFSKLIKEYPDLTLRIYGEGTERARLETLIHSLGLEEKVRLPGIIQNIHEVLIKGDLFVFPSQYEGFPNALCEAMALGLPVVASNCSGNIDIVRDGFDGRLFPVGDVDGLCRVLRELLIDHEQRTLLAKNAQDVCNRFHPDRIFKQWDKDIFRVKNV